MPRHKGKKKKGKIIRPGMEEAVKAKVMTNINDKMKDMGLGGIIGGAAQPTPQMDHLSRNENAT